MHDEANNTNSNFELSAILAHEIKNPMNSIIINIEVLRSAILELVQGPKEDAAERAKKYLDVIEKEVRRLDKVIKGFLDLSAPSQSTKVRFKLNHTIQNILEFMAQEMQQKKVVVEEDLAPDLPPVLGSPDQIKQALLNLFINSLEALPQGGKIDVRTHFDPDHIFISLEDNGHGIDSRIQDRIFNPYFTTKAKGSGLGLTIVRRVMREHGAEIDLQSQSGKGTRFTLKFPRKIKSESKHHG